MAASFSGSHVFSIFGAWCVKVLSPWPLPKKRPKFKLLFSRHIYDAGMATAISSSNVGILTGTPWQRHSHSFVSYTFVAAHHQVAKASRVAPGVVITGGSRGLGFALAHEFLAHGARVALCGRDEGRLQAASEALQREHPHSSLFFMPCDVSKPHDVAHFGRFSEDALQGNIQYWINNAGEVTSKRILTEIDPEEIVRVSNTNVLGSLLCCREAVRIMSQQPPRNYPVYHIFNMGFSRWGAKFTKSACTHKATKIALTQLTVSLNEELKNAGVTNIGVHNLSPGMVLTDLLLKDSTPLSRRFFNVLAEEPETVAAALVPFILNVQGSGQSIEYLSPVTAFIKMLVGFPQIFRGGRFFDEKGDRVQLDGCLYQHNGVKVLF